MRYRIVKHFVLSKCRVGISECQGFHKIVFNLWLALPDPKGSYVMRKSSMQLLDGTFIEVDPSIFTLRLITKFLH